MRMRYSRCSGCVVVACCTLAIVKGNSYSRGVGGGGRGEGGWCMRVFVLRRCGEPRAISAAHQANPPSVMVCSAIETRPNGTHARRAGRQAGRSGALTYDNCLLGDRDLCGMMARSAAESRVTSHFAATSWFEYELDGLLPFVVRPTVNISTSDVVHTLRGSHCDSGHLCCHRRCTVLV